MQDHVGARTNLFHGTHTGQTLACALLFGAKAPTIVIKMHAATLTPQAMPAIRQSCQSEMAGVRTSYKLTT